MYDVWFVVRDGLEIKHFGKLSLQRVFGNCPLLANSNYSKGSSLHCYYNNTSDRYSFSLQMHKHLKLNFEKKTVLGTLTAEREHILIGLFSTNCIYQLQYYLSKSSSITKKTCNTKGYIVYITCIAEIKLYSFAEYYLLVVKFLLNQ